MPDQPYKSTLNNKYIKVSAVNPVYEDKLQKSVNLDKETPLSDAINMARNALYSANSTEGRNNFKGIVLSADRLEFGNEQQYSRLVKYASYANLDAIKYIYRVYIPELHLLGEPPQFNETREGKFDPAIANKIKTYPSFIAAEELQGEKTFEVNEWVNVTFLDSINYEYGIITSNSPEIEKFAPKKVKKTIDAFDACPGSVEDTGIIPDTDIVVQGEDKKRVIVPSDQANDLDLLVFKFLPEGQPIEVFYIVRSFIQAESGGDPFALSRTGCGGFGQFCYGTAINRKNSPSLIGKETNAQEHAGKSLRPDDGVGKLEYTEGPTGALWGSINVFTSGGEPTVDDVMKSVGMNFLGGSTSSLRRKKRTRGNSDAANDYLDYLRNVEQGNPGAITQKMKDRVGEFGIDPGTTGEEFVTNLEQYLKTTSPYQEFTDFIFRKSKNAGYRVVPRADARFDAVKNIKTSYTKTINNWNLPSVGKNPYALYMLYNQGLGFQEPVIEAIQGKNEDFKNLNYKYPSRDKWTPELFQSIQDEISKKNPIIWDKQSPGKYIKYINGIFPVIDKTIKRLVKTFQADVKVFVEAETPSNISNTVVEAATAQPIATDQEEV